MTDTKPVSNWATDFDVFDQQYVNDPFSIWAVLRDECPMAHTDRWGGSWLPTRYEDVTAIARDIEKFPSRFGIAVVPPANPADANSQVGFCPMVFHRLVLIRRYTRGLVVFFFRG